MVVGRCNRISLLLRAVGECISCTIVSTNPEIVLDGSGVQVGSEGKHDIVGSEG